MPDLTLTTAISQHSKESDAADLGYFAITEKEVDDVEELSEPWERYDIDKTPHVFYPVHVGEVLNERYLIEHKIGFGGFSTVWMAHDLQDRRQVALKVISLGAWGDSEILMQDKIIQDVQDSSHLVTYLATFLISGNECQHRVIVFPLMGPCLDFVLLGKLSMATRMSAARQLLEALENLHKAGIVHRGESLFSLLAHFLMNIRQI